VCAGLLSRAAGRQIGDPCRYGARPEPRSCHVAGRGLCGGRSLAAGPHRVAGAPAAAQSRCSCRSLVWHGNPASHQAAQGRGRPGTRYHPPCIPGATSALRSVKLLRCWKGTWLSTQGLGQPPL